LPLAGRHRKHPGETPGQPTITADGQPPVPLGGGDRLAAAVT